MASKGKKCHQLFEEKTSQSLQSLTGPDLGGPWGAGPQASHQKGASHQTRTSNAWIVTKRKQRQSRFLHRAIDNLV